MPCAGTGAVAEQIESALQLDRRPLSFRRQRRSHGSQQLSRRLQMRDVDHLAVYAERAGPRGGPERLDDAPRRSDFGLARGIAGVDYSHLVRMDRHAAEEAVASRAPAIRLQAHEIAKIDVYC